MTILSSNESQLPKDLSDDVKEFLEAQDEYSKAEEFYEGTASEIFASSKVQQLLSRSNLNDIDSFNFAKTPVDTIANRMRVTSLNPLHPDRDIQKQAAQELKDIWRRNLMGIQSAEVHLRTAEFGDSYLYVGPLFSDENDEDDTVTQLHPNPLERDPIAVEMLFHSPFRVRAFYSEDDLINPTHVIKMWESNKGTYRLNVYYTSRTDLYSTKSDKGKPSKHWKQIDSIPNPYNTIPYFHFRNSLPYGKPAHYYAYGPQIAINKIILGHLATIDYQSFPQRYGLMDPMADDDYAETDDDEFHPDDEDQDPESRSNTSRLSADPSSFWVLKGLKGAGQFSAADPNAFMIPLDKYVRRMAQLTDTPLHFFDPPNYEDAPSAPSRRIALGPLLSRGENWQMLLEPTWAGAFAYALRIMGFRTLPIDVRWKPFEVINDIEGWNTFNAKISAGLPPEQGLHEMGYSPEQIELWTAPNSPLMQKIQVNRLAAFADALAKVAAAVQTGAISSNQAVFLMRQHAIPQPDDGRDDFELDEEIDDDTYNLEETYVDEDERNDNA